MFKRLATAGALLLAIAACGQSGDVVAASDTPTPTATPSPTPSPTPEPTPTPESGPRYWRAWFDYITLHHENLSGHDQVATLCVYRDLGRHGWDFVVREHLTVAPRTEATLTPSIPPRLWGTGWMWLQLYGLVGADRHCPRDPARIGAITARARVHFNMPPAP